MNLKSRLKSAASTLSACTIVIATALPILAGSTAAAAETDEAVAATMTRAIDGFIRPGYAAFKGATDGLSTATATLCKTPSEAGLAAARKAFVGTVGTWSSIEMLQAGPVMSDNRLERVLFYPDRKGIGLAQVQAILATKDESAADPDDLADKSVAAQGLGALEFVLFGTGSEVLAGPAEPVRCAYGQAIAGNLATIAGELSEAWADDAHGIAGIWKTPGPDNPVLRSPIEALNQLLATLVHGLETTRDQRVLAFFGREGKGTNPKLAIYWRSAQTMASVAANLEAMRRLFDTARMADLLPEGTKSVAGSIDLEFRSAIAAARALDRPIEEVLTDPEARDKLSFLLLTTESLKTRLSDQYGPAVGLSAGFSFADGD